MTEYLDYDEGVTPGDEQQISDIISDLQDAGLEGDINQQFVQAQEEKLMDTLDTAMLEQSAMKNDVTSLREALQREIKNQRQTLARFATKGTLTKTKMSDDYTQQMKYVFAGISLLVLLLACVFGGACAYLCHKKCIGEARAEQPEAARPEMKTLEMQMATIDSPGIRPASAPKINQDVGPTHSKRPGHTRTNTATRFNLHV